MIEQGFEATISLDVSTLFIVASCVSALLGLFLLFAWRQDRIAALAWWGAAYLVGGFSAALWSLKAIAASPLLSCTASATLFLACGMVWSAARVFHGRRVRWIAMTAGSGAWMLACGLPNFAQMSANRVILAAVIIAAYTFLTAAELWREQRKPLIACWPALLVPALHGAALLFLITLAGSLSGAGGTAMFASGWIAAFVLEMLLYAVGTAFIVLVLTKEHALRLHKTAAMTDPLTGLFNRRGFAEAARQLMQARARRAQPVTVLVFDLDHFKSINDRFGHAVGDEALKLFASLAGSKVRSTDFVARLGGEEFAAIIPGALDEGIIVAERVRVAFETAARKIGRAHV